MKIKLFITCCFLLIVTFLHAQATAPGFFAFPQFNFWVVLLLLAVAGVFIYFTLQLKKINTRIDRRKKISDGDNGSNKRTSQHDSFKSSREIEQISLNSDKISELNDAIFNLQNRLTSLELEIAKPKQPGNQQPPVKAKADPDEVFYMMKPVDDYFPNANKSYQKQDTVYKFTSKQNATLATFEIHTGGAPVNDIAKRNEAYLKPACEEENLPGNQVNNIITKRKGSASLEGDKWIIKTKALIRYE